MSSIAVFGVGELEERIRSELPEPFIDLAVIESTDDTAAVAEAIAAAGALVAVIGAEPDTDFAFDVAKILDRDHPGISVLIVAKHKAATWRRAVQTGVRGVIAPGAPDEELREQLEMAIDAAKRHHDIQSPLARHVITVASPKGGVGKTVLATNLSVALANKRPRDVVLIDLDLQFGDVAPALAVTPEFTMLDAVAATDDATTSTVKMYLTPHDSGLLTLCAPTEPAAAEEISADSVANVLELVSSEFRWVVIDTGSGLGPHALAAMEMSTDIILVSDMDVLSVRNLRRATDALDLLEMTRPHRHLVLNRSNSKVGLSKEDVATAAGMEFSAEVPSSRSVPLSINQGRPLILSNPKAPFSRRISELAERLENGRGPAPPGSKR